MEKVSHISGIVIALIIGIVLIAMGASDPNQSFYLWMGIGVLLCSGVALADGARALPTLGIWSVGAKFEGLSDLAVIIIAVLLTASFFIGQYA